MVAGLHENVRRILHGIRKSLDVESVHLLVLGHMQDSVMHPLGLMSEVD